MELTSLSQCQQALIYLAQTVVETHKWGYVYSVLQQCLILSKYEGADDDIIIAAALFHSVMDAANFTKNILTSIEEYTHESIDNIVTVIEENIVSLRTHFSSLESKILHDAIILADIDSLQTNTAKTMINKKAGLFRMIGQEARKRWNMR